RGKREQQTRSGECVSPEKCCVCPEWCSQAHAERGKGGTAQIAAESYGDPKQAGTSQSSRQSHRKYGHKIRRSNQATRRHGVDSCCAQQRSRDRCCRHREQRQSWRFVRIIMALVVRLVLCVFVIGIDAQCSPLHDGTHQIEARVLVPASTLVKVDVRKEYHCEYQPC